MSTSSLSVIRAQRRRWTRRPFSTAAKQAARWFRPHLKRCWRSRGRVTLLIGGTSTRRRPPTATITELTAAAASPCSAAKCSRSANTLPMSRSATAWEAVSPACRGTAIYGEPTARSRPQTRTSRCAGSGSRRRSFRYSTNYLRKGASVPDTHLAEAARLEAAVPLFSGPNWDFTGLRKVYDGVERIALDDIGLDVYPVQIEVITSEQMLDAYASVGLPLMYRHWSFGKRFAYHETLYRKGLQGLAYEIVINSNPCICYIMEENSMTMQTLVMAHAAFGHNHFFKNNYLFRQWTDANGILDYLAFARDYVAKCEEQHGMEAVERVLDAAHALKEHGVNRYAHRSKPNLAEERQRIEDRRAHEEATFNDLWRTVPSPAKEEGDDAESKKQQEDIRGKLGLPEENLLYFIEKRAPRLEDWQRELIRIVRNVAQYFYPQKQLQMMNEGCAA